MLYNSLKPLDIEVMKRLGTRVNLIPVIAKADTMTPKDLDKFKQRVCFTFLLSRKHAGLMRFRFARRWAPKPSMCTTLLSKPTTRLRPSTPRCS